MNIRYNNTRKKLQSKCRRAVRRKHNYMRETHEFLTPNYFKNFSCKMGSCRSACCRGWPISITMQNYFTLLGVECSCELRDRLDRGMYMSDRPSEDEYARFAMKWDGECALRMADGRCAVHAELGTDALSDVCDLYPRGIRRIPSLECSCAGSCEAVLELLIHQTEPITFAREQYSLRMPRPEKRLAHFETLGRETEIRLLFIRIMQERSLSLPNRLARLGNCVSRMDVALRERDEKTAERLLHDDKAFADDVTMISDIADEARLCHGLDIARRMIDCLDGRSDSIRELGEAALAYFGDGESVKKYETARAHFEECFPNHEIFFEHLMVNHMFFSQFPFQDRPEKLMEEFVALCAVYILLRFLTIGCMTEKSGESDLVDICAALFRLIEHTEFDRYAVRLLYGIGCNTPEALWELVSL